MKTSFAALALAGLVAGCGDDGSSTPDARVTPDAGLALGSAAAIQAWMDGKTFKMDGANIPSHPNGFNEDQNLGNASQCYVSVTMVAAAQNLSVTSVLGTIENAPNVLDVGTCNHTAANGQVSFTSTSVLIENVKNNAECFDITVTYTGFAQEGRGKIAADGKTMTLELYFANRATGHRCASGNVGATGVTVSGAPFTGNAQQVYVVQ